MQVDGLQYVVDIDIHGFFGPREAWKTVETAMDVGNKGQKLISIISAMLKAEVAGIGFQPKEHRREALFRPCCLMWCSMNWTLVDNESMGRNEDPYP